MSSYLGASGPIDGDSCLLHYWLLIRVASSTRNRSPSCFCALIYSCLWTLIKNLPIATKINIRSTPCTVRSNQFKATCSSYTETYHQSNRHYSCTGGPLPFKGTQKGGSISKVGAQHIRLAMLWLLVFRFWHI